MWLQNNYNYLFDSVESLTLVLGTQYKFSVEIRTTALTKNGLRCLLDFRKKYTVKNSVVLNIPANNNGVWQKLENVFTINDSDCNSALIRIESGGNTGYKGVQIEYRNFRLERIGDKMAYLDNNGVTYLWNKIKALFNKGITGLKVSGRTITYTKGDGTTGTITTQDTTYGNMKGATASADGASGLVPAPTKGNEGKYLKADGTWGTPANTTYATMKGATTDTAGASGLVPAPTAGAATRYLRSDGTWVTPPNTTYADATQSAHGLMTATDKKKLDGIAEGANKYVHPTTSGNKHIPSGGSSGQILRWSADGTAVWGADKDTTYSDFGLPSASAAGKNGLVPAPPAGEDAMFLSSNHGWVGWSILSNYQKDEINIEMLIANIHGDSQSLGSASLSSATSSMAGVMSATDKAKLDALPTNATLSGTYAKKSEITNMYKYMGSVADASKLPTAGQRTGDVYNIETATKYGGAGMNVAWNGSAWDPLGEIFKITAITNAEIDAICV